MNIYKKMEDEMKNIKIDEATLLFLLDKVENCYYEECKKIVDKLLKNQ